MDSKTPGTREELLALTPEIYLRDGYRRPDGAPRPEATTIWPLAAAEQLLAKKLDAPALDAALGPALRALIQPGIRQAQGQGALLAVANEAKTPPAVRALCKACALAILSDADVPVAAAHLAAVVRLLALKKALTQK